MSAAALVVPWIAGYATSNFQVTAGMNGRVEIADPATIAGGATLKLAPTANASTSPAYVNRNIALLGDYMAPLFRASAEVG
jgi:hypothetical protein